MNKKILILYAEYGSGHKSIAKNIANYLIEHNNKCEVKLLNLTSYANLTGKVGLNIMKFVSKYRPEKIFDACYSLSDHYVMAKGGKKYGIKSFDNDHLRRTINKFNPDITISTHFYCSNLISYYNKKKIISTKLITTVTDYCSHEAWTINHKEEDGFIVGNEIVKNELIKRGVPKRKIYCFGIPLANKTIVDNKKNIKLKYKINNNKKIVLFFGGSSAGSIYYFKYLKALAGLRPDINLIFISGHNDKLKKKAKELVKKERLTNWIVLGYTTDVFNLYRISDFVITKPGGATVTECLEFKKPMLLVPGVGGQEKHNTKFIEKKKYGVYAKNRYRFKKACSQMINNSKYLEGFNKRLEKQNENKSLQLINNLIKKI